VRNLNVALDTEVARVQNLVGRRILHHSLPGRPQRSAVKTEDHACADLGVNSGLVRKSCRTGDVVVERDVDSNLRNIGIEVYVEQAGRQRDWNTLRATKSSKSRTNGRL
jgi:hypothetical protein